jgi:hypothetical protein
MSMYVKTQNEIFEYFLGSKRSCDAASIITSHTACIYPRQDIKRNYKLNFIANPLKGILLCLIVRQRGRLDGFLVSLRLALHWIDSDIHTYIPLTLYPRRGSSGISDILPKCLRFTKITLL